LSLTGLLASLILIFKYRDMFTMESILVFVTAVLYISLLGSPMKAIDQGKSMESDIKNFVSQIPESERPHIAGVDLNETTVACLFYYGDLKVPIITDKQEIDSILAGKDGTYDSLMINTRSRTGDDTNLSDSPYRVIAKTVTGTDRALYLIKGENGN
jgi:hypothetical protein